MAAVLSPPSTSASPSPPSFQDHTSSASHSALSTLPTITTAAAAVASPQPRPQTKRTKSSSSKSRQSTHSTSSQLPGTTNRRQSQRLSTTSRTASLLRNSSTVFPLFNSSLPYTLVRDFGYPTYNPLHYGPPPAGSSDLATPASESNRRLSDPVPSWDGGRTTTWSGAASYSAGGWPSAEEAGFRLPNTSFSDGDEGWGGGIDWKKGSDGPPYSEDEDLQSPVISAAHGHHHRSKQHGNSAAYDRRRGRPRSKEGAAGAQGVEMMSGKRRKRKARRRASDGAGKDIEEKRASRATLPSRSFHEGETYSSSEDDASSDGDADSESASDDSDDEQATPVLADSRHHHHHHLYRTSADSSGGAFADSPHPGIASPSSSNSDDSDLDDAANNPGNPSRHSLTYTFSIASPDEECHGKAVSLYNFERENDNELPLAEGQIILVSYRLSQGWLVAQDPRSGESGLVPESYVRLFRDLEGWDGGDGENEPGGAAAAAAAAADADDDDDDDGVDVQAPDSATTDDSAGGPSASSGGGVQLPTNALDTAGAAVSAPAGGGDEAPLSASPDSDADAMPPPSQQQDSAKTPTTPASGHAPSHSRDAAHKPAVTSTFSTSRDDLEPRKDLVSEERRRGSLDRSGSGSGGRKRGKS